MQYESTYLEENIREKDSQELLWLTSQLELFVLQNKNENRNVFWSFTQGSGSL